MHVFLFYFQINKIQSYQIMITYRCIIITMFNTYSTLDVDLIHFSITSILYSVYVNNILSYRLHY